MREYTLIFKDGRSETVLCEGREALVNHLFDGDVAEYQRQVRRLRWASTTVQYVQDVASGKVHAQLATADVNPYGWRNESFDRT